MWVQWRSWVPSGNRFWVPFSHEILLKLLVKERSANKGENGWAIKDCGVYHCVTFSPVLKKCLTWLGVLVPQIMLCCKSGGFGIEGPSLGVEVWVTVSLVRITRARRSQSSEFFWSHHSLTHSPTHPPRDWSFHFFYSTKLQRQCDSNKFLKLLTGVCYIIILDIRLRSQC
jgi:hypothetical protein